MAKWLKRGASVDSRLDADRKVRETVESHPATFNSVVTP